ncbi:hypothetical protein CFOLD11_22260 [Clostridium folliculivorans]|uniref:Uncharacterized protein n=1 Tax=Clostridium folliculivorans TaxID=2886038 RepID=A0A9W5Y2L2_9CLOT|nr:hypothetical protein [Clostridium folliculivorans]GKU25400.1 hypothetical protein CFOLD11_22260 [Clostridium folliculivorans]
MTKYIKNLGLYFIIAVILQVGVLYYINNFYLSGFSSNNEDKSTAAVNSTNATSTKSNDKNNSSVSGKNEIDTTIKFSVPEDSTEIELSKENDKVAYIKDSVLQIVGKTENNTVDFQGLKLLKYQWLDEGNLVVATSKENSTSVSFYKYDISTKEKELLASIQLKDKKASINSIISSPLKDLIFVKVDLSNGGSEIYKLNVRNEFEKVALRESKIQDIYLIPHEDKLIYNSSLNSNVYVTYLEQKLSLTQKGLTRILGVDKSENVYIGLISNGNVSKIYYGSIGEKTSTWKQLSLNNIEKAEDLIVVENSIYKLNSTENKLEDLNGTTSISFKGKFLKICNGKVLSMENGNVYIN